MSLDNIIINASCINIEDLKRVTILTFVVQLISIGCIIISTSMVCLVYWQPLCSKKRNRILSDDSYEGLSRHI